MSTQHRPTFFAAVAKSTNSSYKSTHMSVKDQNTHTVLKYRQHGQHSKEEMKQTDMRMELQRREAALMDEKKLAIAMVAKEEKTISVPLLLTASDTPVDTGTQKYDDSDADFGDSDGSSSDDRYVNININVNVNFHFSIVYYILYFICFILYSDDDDDDEEAELQRELEKIKAERLATSLKKEEDERLLAEATHKESALRGNPLLNSLSNDDTNNTAKVKRKWNDDVVFRNQAATEPETKKRFVNDTIRNDFHRSFLKKYVC